MLVVDKPQKDLNTHYPTYECLQANNNLFIPYFQLNSMESSIEHLLSFGIINIDKPSGPTSFSISDYVRNALKLNKTSHFGTLDPQVSGVLPIALGRACRLNEFFMHRNKTYVGIMRLHSEVKKDELQKVINKFIGKINQMPPVKSRVKRALREREVFSFNILEIEGKDVLFETEVQAGTYIRKICMHSDVEILSSNGLIKAKDFYLNPSAVYSFDSHLIKKYPSEVQKIIAPDKIVKIKTSSGIEFAVTKDHKLLISSAEGYKMIEAEKLTCNDYLVKLNSFTLPTKKYFISDLLDDDYLIEQPEIKQECKLAMIKKFGSIRAMNRKIKLDRKAFLSNSKNSISIKHLKFAGIYENVKNKLRSFKTNKGRVITLESLTPDHCYLLGLIASDGNNTREKRTIRFTRLKFHNKNEQLIDHFLKIYKRLFINVPISKKEIKPHFFQLDTSNSFFASIASNLGIKSPNKYSDLLPIAYLPNDCIKSFLRGYFDGDGTAHYKIKDKIKGIYSNISFFSVNYTNAKRLHQMLAKLNITSKIFRNTNGLNSVSLSNIASKKKFIAEIGSNHPNKLEIFAKIVAIKDDRMIDDCSYIGFNYKELIRKNKSKLYALGGNLMRILNSNIPISKGFYNRCSKLVNLPVLDNLIIEKIKNISELDGGDFVYDLTVPKVHNFLIETGFISSNCDDMGKELDGAHMLELRRTKAGLFSEDKIATLYEFDKAVEEYQAGNDKELRKLIVPAEEALDKLLPKIEINPASLKKLLTGKPLMKHDLEGKEPKEEIYSISCNKKFVAVVKKSHEGDIIARPLFVFN